VDVSNEVRQAVCALVRDGLLAGGHDALLWRFRNPAAWTILGVPLGVPGTGGWHYAVAWVDSGEVFATVPSDSIHRMVGAFRRNRSAWLS
jgi:hypothetical protein